jgi:type II secretory pathway predicted ATPase ExeA
MYETRFGFRQRPFPATPDSTFYYPASNHEQALTRLLRALANNEGLVLLTGEPGVGKTLLCHCLLEQLGPDVATAFLTNSRFGDRRGLFQAILYDLSLPYEGLSEQELRLKLTDFLLKNCGAGKRTVLVVDEAQHLTPDLLEELRLLGNLEAGHGKAFQVVLVAQPSLLQKLGSPELTACSQRLVVRLRLEPLGMEETVDYLLHQLRTAGGQPEAVMTEEALHLLAQGGRGVPRLLNQAGHHTLLLAEQVAAEQVDAEVVLEALAELGLSEEEAEQEAQEGPGKEETPLFAGEKGSRAFVACPAAEIGSRH